MFDKVENKIVDMIRCMLIFLVALAVMYLAQGIVTLFASFMMSRKAAAQGITDELSLLALSAQITHQIVPYRILITHTAFILVFGVWYKKICEEKEQQKRDLRRIFRPQNLVGMVLIAIGSCYALNLGMELIFPYIPTHMAKNYVDMMERAQMGVNPVTILASVLLAPIGEEFIFRGVLFHNACKVTEGIKNKRVAFWIANSIQAVFFGIFHLNVIQGVYAFGMGLLIGYVVYCGKSVTAGIFVHMVFNILSTFTSTMLFEVLPGRKDVYGVALGISLVIMIIGLFLMKEKKCMETANS